jgi:hypothetical protein
MIRALKAPNVASPLVGRGSGSAANQGLSLVAIVPAVLSLGLGSGEWLAGSGGSSCC